MNALNQLGPRQRQQVVIALQVAAVIAETLAPVVGFLKPFGLDHGPHGAVDNQNSAAQGGFEGVRGGVRGVHRASVPVGPGT